MRRLSLGLAIGVLLLAGCGAEEESSAPSGETLEGESESGGLAPAPAGEPVGGGDDSFGAVPGSDVPAVGPTVIKTADVAVEVERDGFADAMASMTDIAARHDGFVVRSTRSGEESRRGSVTVRIPSDRFETALGEIRALGTVQRETVAGEDVGQEFVDLEARLRNLHATEAVLLRLFDEATSVADTIRIQSELTGIQLEIERIEGRLRYLSDQTALGTISVSLSEEGVSAPGRFGNAFDRAWDGILAILSGLVIFLGYALPFGIIGVLLWLLWRRVGPRFKTER